MGEKGVLVKVLLLLPPQPLESCQTCGSSEVRGNATSDNSMHVEGRFESGPYLGGLWRCAHGLRVGRAVVSCLLAIVLRPGSTVVWLAAGLGGCSRSWGLRGCLTWGGRRMKDTFSERALAPGWGHYVSTGFQDISTESEFQVLRAQRSQLS